MLSNDIYSSGYVAEACILTVHSIENGEFTGDNVLDGISGNLLSSADIVASTVEADVTIDTATNLLSTTMDSERLVTVAVEFMSGAAGNVIEVAGEVVVAVTEVMGKIVSQIINSN